MAEDNPTPTPNLEENPKHTPAVQPASPVTAVSSSKMMGIIRSILFVIIGIWAIVLSINIGDMDKGDYELSHAYGGDAYTGMQNASAQTSKNTMYSNEILRKGFSSVLLIAGLGFISFGATSIKKD